MQLKQFEKYLPRRLLPAGSKKPNFPFGYRPKTWHFIILTALLVIGYLYLSKDVDKNTREVKINGHIIKAEIADDPKEQALGLMFRKNLAENSGMLFIYERSARYSFWMKNTKIPLDIIWIDEGLNIVHIEHSVPPCTQSPCLSYRPPAAAKYVVEVNGGWAIKNGVKIGDTVDL